MHHPRSGSSTINDYHWYELILLGQKSFRLPIVNKIKRFTPLNLFIIYMLLGEYDTPSEGPPKCITESGLDLHSGLVMVPTDQLSKNTFQQCVHYCMNFAPDLNHLLISYYNNFLVSDKVCFVNILRSHCRSISFLSLVYQFREKV